MTGSHTKSTERFALFSLTVPDVIYLRYFLDKFSCDKTLFFF
jgi:hypothetical protein